MTEVLHNEPQKLELCNVIYSSYTESQKKATLKYREKNRDKVNEQRKIYYKQRKENDPQFLEYKRTKSREYYQRKKHEKENLKEIDTPIDEPKEEEEKVEVEVEIPVIEDDVEKIEHYTPIVEKIKKQRKPKIPELEPQPEVVKSELIEFDKQSEDEKIKFNLINFNKQPKRNNKRSKVSYEV